MGESIAEGTIVRWMKKIGEPVDRDEPLFEISTDKVDAEIPSPAAGVLTEIAVTEGQTVPVNSIVATISTDEEVSVTAPPATAPPVTATPATTAASDRAPVASPPEASGRTIAAASTQQQGDGAGGNGTVPTAANGVAAPAGAPAAPSQAAPATPSAEAPKQRSSPLVRRIAKEHNVDVGQIHGSGSGGRVTKHDILGYLESHRGGSGDAAERRMRERRQGGERVEVRPLSIMRRKIAEHMILSRRTSAHVHSVFHVNFSTVDRIRKAKKAAYEAQSTKLTYMSFITQAIVDALQRHPIVNASLDEGNVLYKKDINVGIAVAVEGGLIVPVVKHADEMNMVELSRAIADVAERSRTKQLKPEEVHGGTFTITNPGQFGAQFGMPIINQPQVAILGVGTVEKRPVVIDDAIGIRPMAYLTLGYDHRLIDGAIADQFMADVKKTIEEFDEKRT
jgi:2-oxoglutarate dehydrogenase E2 component (dihydrolipoamide succinyltransferase)